MLLRSAAVGCLAAASCLAAAQEADKPTPSPTPPHETVDVTSTVPIGPQSQLQIDGDAVRDRGGRLSSRALVGAVATGPGWSSDDNGLVHYRGVDDGFLYVIDGVPVYERIDPRFGLAPDPAGIASVTVVSGYVPPEYGLRSGAVVVVRSESPARARGFGSVDASLGSEDEQAYSVVAGGPLGTGGRLIVSGTHERSARFLDAVDVVNLHNAGHASRAQAEYVWTDADDAVVVRTEGGQSGFDVPSTPAQAAAGADSRQTVAQAAGSLSWQRNWGRRTTLNAAAYARWTHGELLPGAADEPLRAESRRSLRRAGLLAAVTHESGLHAFKLGFEAASVSLDETFGFAVTDADAGDAAGLSPAALAFTPEAPFDFAGTAQRPQYSVYAQDSWRTTPRLSLALGVRFDQTHLLLDERQLSPRLGLAYRVDDRTTLRMAVNRFFQPPQSEYLLLASSDAARALSPFADRGGGADVPAERQTSVEVAAERAFGPVRAQVALWHRAIRNQGDPNVFFSTSVIFPNSMSRGRARGLDLRLDLGRRAGWSGYLSYTLSRIVQYGPLSGGLFLEGDAPDIGVETRLTPDHDRRHVAAASVTWSEARGRVSLSFSGRFQSGAPLEVEGRGLEDLFGRPGADRVDFATARTRPYAVFDVSARARVARLGATEIDLRAAVFNLGDSRYAFNFGNPFSGTHFGAPRSATVGLRAALR
jgi:outer membrane receptor protein involved in Fe transport